MQQVLHATSVAWLEFPWLEFSLLETETGKRVSVYHSDRLTSIMITVFKPFSIFFSSFC